MQQQPKNPVPAVLSIQDMSAIGRCSLTVALPILSALGCQCVPLPTAVLSNHLEYPKFTLVDFTEHLSPFMDTWEDNGIHFEAIQSGFLASPEQIHLVMEAIDRFANDSTPIIVDPAMADDGKLYAVYTPDMVTEMRRLISRADVIKPNYTEALFLLDRPYSTDILTESEIKDLCRDLSKMGPRHVILSSIPHQTEAYVAVYDGETDELQKASTPLIPVKAHGSGDIFTAVLTGMWLRGLSPRECAQKAATFTTQALQYTVDHADSLRDGLLFEALMKELVNL